MRPISLVLLAVVVGALPACAPKVVARGTTIPAPLPQRPFTPPPLRTATLSNGLTVSVVEDHEVPLAWVRLAFRPGGHTDPAGKEGLAAVTLDMLNEGAGEYDAVGLSAALRSLGSDLGSSASDDGASIWASGLSRTLDPTLDLLATVLLDPTFPDTEWDLMRKQRTAALDRERKDADWIAGRVMDRVLFGDVYRGRAPSADSYAAITTADMRAWWAANLTPDQAVLLAGGDLTLDDLVSKLEARLSAWRPKPTSGPASSFTPQQADGSIHLVDRPGAAQSVVRVGGYVTAPSAAEWSPLVLANQAVGGQFTARLNMNLREEKGWTYGARTGLSYDLAGGRFQSSAGIVTAHTAEALSETLKELTGPTTDRPLTDDELTSARDSIVLAWPLRFESPDFLLGQTESAWRYGLPADWVTGYVDRLRAVTLDASTAAWKDRIDTSKLAIVVVGDAAVVRDGLAGLGRTIVEHDADGNVLSPKE